MILEWLFQKLGVPKNTYLEAVGIIFIWLLSWSFLIWFMIPEKYYLEE